MKKLIYIILLISISCSSQKNKQMVKKIDLSNYQEMNYIFARIHNSKPISKEFYKGSLYATIFHLSWIVNQIK